MIEHSGRAGVRFICSKCGETKDAGEQYYRKGEDLHCATCGKP